MLQFSGMGGQINTNETQYFNSSVQAWWMVQTGFSGKMDRNRCIYIVLKVDQIIVKRIGKLHL